MSLKRLNEEDKSAILELYRQTAETTSTLADRFGVSSSTVSRFLKASLSENEYDHLIQQKRLARGSKADSQLALLLEEAARSGPAPLLPNTDKPPLLIRSRKRKSSAIDPEISTDEARNLNWDSDTLSPDASSNIPSEMGGIHFDLLPTAIAEASIAASLVETPVVLPSPSKPILKGSFATTDTDLAAIVKDLDDDLDDLNDLNDLDDDELDDLEELESLQNDDEEEEEEEEEEDNWIEDNSFMPTLREGEEIKVLPLKSAVFPPTCYLVIDRTSELIVRPLKEFAHLGTIPSEEVQQKTLPVFDSHHVARRFSHRTQRVIKVPDSQILHKTSSHLQAKGITRIFLDGQVYALDRQ